MKLLLLGAGEAFEADNFGNNAALLYGKNIPTVLFDCGYQIPERFWQYKKHVRKLECIYITHLHADHCFGLAPLLTYYLEENRQDPLTIIGPTGIKRLITRLSQQAYPSTLKKIPFKLIFIELPTGGTHAFKNLNFKTARSEHSVKNLSVRVTGPQQKNFCISGDGNLTKATKKLFAGTDLLLHEVYFPQPMGPNHCDLQTLRAYLDTAGIKKTIATHTSRHYRQTIKKLLCKNLTDHKCQLVFGTPQTILSL